MAAVLHHDPCEMVLGDPGGQREALSSEPEEGRRGRQTRLLLPGVEERGADDALGHLLGPKDEHRVVLPRPNGRRGEHEGRTSAGATRLDIDDRHAGHTEPAQDLVPGGDAAVGRSAEGRLKASLAHARLTQRGPHSHHAHVGGRDAVETAERMHADPCDHDSVVHEAPSGAKANVTTSLPSASRCSGTMRNSIGWPAESATGSLSVRRAMTRIPSGSSTTPTPKGTSPS